MDFQPFSQRFQFVNEYLSNFMADINNPSYFQKFISPFEYVQIIPSGNDSHIEKFLASPACNHRPYACQSKMKLEQF